MSNIKKIWRDFVETPFPADSAGLCVDGIDLLSLDINAAGCIDTYLRNGDTLDAERMADLELYVLEIERAVEMLGGDARDYFEQLHLLSQEVLRLATRSETVASKN